MTIEEAKKEIIESGIELGAGDYIDIEALRVAITVMGAYEQVRWERDIAMGQLKELGLSFVKRLMVSTCHMTSTMSCLNISIGMKICVDRILVFYSNGSKISLVPKR